MNLSSPLIPGLSSTTPLAATAALLEVLPWGVLVLDAQGVIRYLNQQAAAWYGIGAEALLGQPLAEAPLPAALGATLQPPLPGSAAPREVWLPGTQQWLGLRTVLDPTGSHWVFCDNITARKQAEAAQQRNSQLLLDMEAVAHTGSYEADLASGSFYLSDGMYRLFGEAPQAIEVTLAVIDARSHPDDVATVRQVLDEAVRTRQPYTYRRRIRRADGAWRTLEAHGEVRTDATGQAVQLRGLVQDVTERVQAEQQLHASHELLQRTIDSSLDMMQVFEAVRDEQGAVVDFTWVLNNDAAERVYGDVIGQRLCELNPGVVKAGIFDAFRQVLATGMPDQREHHYVHEQFDGWFYQSTVKLGDGVTTTHDISARRRLEQELRDSHTLLQDIIDAPDIGLAVYRAVRNDAGAVVDFTHEYINRASQEMLGEDFTGRRFTDHGENGRLQLAQLREVLETGRRNRYLREADFRGRRVWFAITNTPLDGDRLVHTWEDVTERQQAQQEILRLKEELAQQATDKYRTLFTAIDEGFCLLERVSGSPADFVYVEANDAFARQLGTGSVVGRTIRDVFPGAPEAGYAFYEQVWQTGEPVHTELAVPSIGRILDVQACRVENRSVRQVAVVFSDITARKRREADAALLVAITEDLNRLVSEEEMLAAVGAQLTQHFDLACWHYVDVDETREEVTLRHFWHAQDVPPILGTYPIAGFLSPPAVASLRGGVPAVVADVQAIASSDSATGSALKAGAAAQRIAAYIAVPYSVGGQWKAYFALADSRPRPWTAAETALVQDVAARVFPRIERARAEAALRESEAQFRTVANLVPDLLWRSTPDSDTDWYNEQWYDYTGQTPETAAGYGWTDVIHPDDRAESARRYRAALASGQLLRQEHRIRSAQGEYRWFQVQARALRDEHGTVAAWYGAATDIHARKQMEEALRRSEEKYRTLFDSIDEGFALYEVCTDDRGQVVDMLYHEANSAFRQQSGVQDAIGQKTSELFPHTEQAWLDALTRVYQTGVGERLEDYHADTNRWFSLYYVRIGGKGSPLIAVVFNDITARKRHEQEQAFLLALSDAFRTQPTAEAIGTLATRLVAEHLRADRCYIAQFSRAQELGWIGPEYQAAELPPLSGQYRFADFPEGMKRIETDSLVIRDLLRDPGLSDTDKQSIGQLLGVQGMLAAVLREGERNYFWCLTAATAQPRDWTEADLKFLENVAERTWAAMERARTETALRESEEKYRTLFDSIDEGFALEELVYDANGEIADIIFREVNRSYERQAGLTNVVGKSIKEVLPNLEQHWKDVYAQLARTGEPVRLINYAQDVDRWFDTYLTLLAGSNKYVAVVFNDITERKRRELNTALLDEIGKDFAILTAPDELMQAVGKRLGEFLALSGCYFVDVDEANNEVSVHYGWASGQVPSLMQTFRLEDYLSEDFLRTMRAGAVFVLRDTAHDSRAEAESFARLKVGSFVTVPFFRQGRYVGHIAVTTERAHAWQPQEIQLLKEVSSRIFPRIERARAEKALRASQTQLAELNTALEQRVAERTQQLQTSRDLLQSVFDTSLISMSVLYAVRDEAGQVQDFRLFLVNKELERETGRTDLVGKLYAQEYPGVRQAGIFDLMLRTLATNEPQTLEYFYGHEGFNRWYTCQFVKMGDGLVATSLDITERKLAEQERLKNLRLLEQAEAVAGLGSWDYDLASGHMRWSDGMYHLVDLPLGQPVSPEVYLRFVVSDDRPRAEQLVRWLTSGHSVEETLRLRVGEHLKTVRLKAVVLRDDAGQPVRVLGVDLDISALQRLDQENLRLRLSQQQVLFEAVQEAQEEERRRLAEGLHNGIGQILYATKLRLDWLPADSLNTLPAVAVAHREANQLLSEAIRQTRTLSHELTPLVLEEFGLAAALQDISRKMSSPQLHLSCQLLLDDKVAPLTPALQLALYRMGQELAQNIIRHAHGATEASLELETIPGWVLLRAEDNGPGFSPLPTSRPGLGLRSIRDRVKLLAGQVESGSFPSGGAYVRIRIPLPPSETPAAH